MVYKNTKLSVIDNSGVSLVRVIHIFRKGMNKKPGSVGDILKVSVQRLRKSIPTKRAKKGEVLDVLLVCMRRIRGYKTGVVKRSSLNGTIVLNKERDSLLSNRVVQPVDSHLRNTRFARIAVLAPKIFLTRNHEAVQV